MLVSEFGNCGIPEQNFHLNPIPPQAKTTRIGAVAGMQQYINMHVGLGAGSVCPATADREPPQGTQGWG